MNYQRDALPVTDSRQLTEYLASGCRPAEQWGIGTEHEKFGFFKDDHRPLPYHGERGIRAILEGLQQFGWKPVMENDQPIGLEMEGCNISLEPGGQLELSGDLLKTIHQTCTEVNTHLEQVKAVADPLGIGFLGMGFQPKWGRDDIPWMPKGRYKIMRDYMPKVGSLGLDMMKRTCTVQVNLDFSDEADMVKKFRVSLALQPLATALFANSPFVDGQVSDFVSYRSHIWSDTDADRTGMLPFVFESGMGFERYTEYMLDVPMYFVYRDGRYIDASGLSFRDFVNGRLSVLPGEHPTLKDWDDHLTTAFPEVRLKRFLEMRGADGGPWRRLCALPAFWVGLLYDSTALDAAWDLVKDWSLEQRMRFRDEVPQQGLKTLVNGRPARELALEIMEIARTGLRNRACLNGAGDDETGFLDALHTIAESGITPAERKAQALEQEWDGDINAVFRECAY